MGVLGNKCIQHAINGEIVCLQAPRSKKKNHLCSRVQLINTNKALPITEAFLYLLLVLYHTGNVPVHLVQDNHQVYGNQL